MLTLKFFPREIVGKKVKHLRKQNLIPAEIYGHNVKNQHISVNKNEFLKIFKIAEKSSIIELINEKGEKIPVIVQDIQKHPINDEIITIDFHQIKLTEKIKTKIPIELINEAPALKKGYIIIKNINEIEIEALAKNLPHKIEVDISNLENLKQSIHVKDLKLDKNIKILTDPETIIVSISEAIKEEVEEEKKEIENQNNENTSF